MTPDTVIDLGREAIMITLLLSAPALLVGMLVGLIVGLLQALTQIQEQTVAFVPKIVAMVLAISVSLPWLITQMSQYVVELFSRVPDAM
ncbi:MAG: flagellar biosynthesis protein FliQ [Planctomycetaceae bacterium]|nr:flagellar biosynthesis protein FliQ [Planctomycetaceae bacterium]